MIKELIIRGNKSKEIIEYFEGIASSESGQNIHYTSLSLNEENQENHFTYRIQGITWFVELTKERSINIGSMIFPEVVVKISAPKELIEDIIYKFRIQFLSAGG